MVVETGYQMPTSAVAHLLIVVIFSIVYIFTRDVPYYDHRCVISNAPPLAPSSPSVSPPTPPRGRDKMDGTHICTARELMRWLTALLCFVDAKYDTLEKGNCTAAAKKIIDTDQLLDVLTLDPGGDDAEMKMNAVPTLNPGKITNTKKISDVLTLDPGGDNAEMKMSAVPTLNPDKIINTGEDGEKAVRILNPGKIINTEKLLDTGEDGEDADLRLNPEKVIDTAQILDTILKLEKTQTFADLTLNPAKIIDTD